MIKAGSAERQLRHSMGSAKKTRNLSKSSAADVADVSIKPAATHSQPSTKNNTTVGTADATTTIARYIQTTPHDTNKKNALVWAQSQLEDENSINNYFDIAAADTAVETSSHQFEAILSQNVANPHSIIVNHEGVQAPGSTVTHLSGEEDEASMSSEELEENAYQLEQWAHNISNEKMTVHERLEKTNWSYKREEKL